MSKKPKPSTVGAEFETTIIFPAKARVEELAKAKRDTKKRTQSANGTLGEKIAKAVEEDHLSRFAFTHACQFDNLDDERLHIEFHSFLKYCEDLGVTKRATAQEELFDGGDGGEPSGKIKDAAKDDGETETARKPRAPRKVAETPGKDDQTNVSPFKPMH